ncbi:MAG: DUF2784 domain-containing protein [Acidobacteriota bacterium]
MTNHHAANGVCVLHIVFVVLALAGGFGVLLSPWWMLVHVPVVLWSAIINLAGGTCPLTPLESKLRGETGAPGLGDGFIAHYIGPLLYPGATARQLERLVGVFIVVWNLLVYVLVFWLRAH